MFDKEKKLNRVVLEMSLKPFKCMDDDYIRQVCEEALSQWLPLTSMAEKCSALFWVAEGSDILTWSGNLDDEIEWGRYIGHLNDEFLKPERLSTPITARLYMDNPPKITYRDLRNIISIFKEVAENKFNTKLTIGATFDPGPEFAHSDFKYKFHPEILKGEIKTKGPLPGTGYTVVCPWAKLKGDSTIYAAYPNGIPDGLSFGAFLGSQCKSYLSTMGFDYIWFSNGFGFSFYPWTYLGANFNGHNFQNADYEELSNKILSFWRDFKEACPDYPIEVRGTNMATGMDLASDFVPLMDIYKNKFIEVPPPNSPWGALDSDFGLEMAGYMSRIAEIPGKYFPFRYYPNDPWYWQNPWWDCYDREAFDIYCPMSVGRVNKENKVENPSIIEFLTIDTEKGDLIEDCPLEIIPHIRKAIKDYPDQPGVLTWLYPFKEFHEIAAKCPDKVDMLFFGDWFIRNAINEGLPLNTVMSTDVFSYLMEHKTNEINNTIFVVPTIIFDFDCAEKLLKHIYNGGKVLLYGPIITDDRLCDLLNIKLLDGIDGEFTVETLLPEDEIIDGSPSNLLKHDPLVSAGPLREAIADNLETSTIVRAKCKRGDEQRVYALSRNLPSWNGGRVSWVRGSLPFGSHKVSQLPERYPNEYMDPSPIMRKILCDFGYTFLQRKGDANSRSAIDFVSRHDNGFFFSGHKPDTTGMLEYAFPQGVPLLKGKDAIFDGNKAVYYLDKSFHEECRVFVKQSAASVISCKEKAPVPTAKKQTERILRVSGLKNAEVNIYPPLEALKAGRVEIQHGLEFIDLEMQKGGNFIGVSDKISDNYVHLDNISGIIDISW